VVRWARAVRPRCTPTSLSTSFFFSSRRRHTRFSRDWSSDVCSSDLLRLFVTLEPCAMCLGAMLHARLREIVFAAPDPKTGSCGGLIDLSSNTRLNHQTGIRSGLLADECSEMLRRFFRERRQQAKGAADPAER